jgi:phosphoribosylanthranilate isomerase
MFFHKSALNFERNKAQLLFYKTMPLKTLVKVGNISNLSDARYCAGMGVEMLGFTVIEGKENFINPKSYQEIRGWVSGPSIVAEIYGINDHLDIAQITEAYAPDFLELSIIELDHLPETTLPLIVSLDQTISGEQKQKLDSVKDRTAFILIDDPIISFPFIKEISRAFPVLIMIRSSVKISELLSVKGISGISLNGSQEIKPGLKDYSHLSNVLEQLETD